MNMYHCTDCLQATVHVCCGLIRLIPPRFVGMSAASGITSVQDPKGIPNFYPISLSGLI